MGSNSISHLWDTLALNLEQFSQVVSDVLGAEVVVPDAATPDAAMTGDVTQDAAPSDKPPWWPDYLGVPWPPYLMRPTYDDLGQITGYEEDENAFDWDAFTSMKRSFGTPEEERVLSLDDLIAQALGQVGDWSDRDDPNLQKAQRLFDFKKQPTDSERLRLALDIAQSPSDYMTLVGLYTGAIARNVGPARVGEKVAPLMPYLQQMAQRFFAGTSLMPEATYPPEDLISKDDEALRAVETTTGEEVGISGPMTPREGYIAPEAWAGWADEEFLEDGEFVGGGGQYGGINFPSALDEVSPITPPEGYIAPEAWAGGGTEEFEGDGEFGGGGQYGGLYSPYTTDPAIKAPPATLSEAWQRQAERAGWNTQPEEFVQADAGEEAKWGIDELEWGGSYQQGGVVPGKLGDPKLIRAEGGEIVIPNAVQSPYMKSLFGKTFIPRRETLGRFLSSPAKAQIPSMIGGDFRFRSPQSIRSMTPTQRRLFQEGIRSFGIPWEDFSMQERLATGAGGPGRSRIQFRRPSFVRG